MNRETFEKASRINNEIQIATEFLWLFEHALGHTCAEKILLTDIGNNIINEMPDIREKTELLSRIIETIKKYRVELEKEFGEL